MIHVTPKILSYNRIDYDIVLKKTHVRKVILYSLQRLPDRDDTIFLVHYD